MASIKMLDLDSLYELVAEKGKCTPAVFTNISKAEDFSTIQPRFCDSVCRVATKEYDTRSLDLSQADVVIVMTEKSRGSKFRTGMQEDSVFEGIIDHLMRTEAPSLTYKLVYAVKCRQALEAPKLTVTGLRPCGQYLGTEIRRSRPKTLIATSTEALKALGLDKASVRRNLSEILYWEDIPVVVTLHPKVTTMIRQNSSGAFWGDDFYELIRRDFVKAALCADGVIPRISAAEAVQKLIDADRIHILNSLEDVEALCRRLWSLPESRVISWDTETTGLDPWAPDAKFLCHQFGIREADGLSHSYVIPLWHRDNVAYDPDKAWIFVEMVLTSPVTKVGHHSKFDLKYTRVVKGTRVVNCKFDTLYASHSLCSGLQGTYGLKKAVWDWLPETGLGGYEDLLSFTDEVDEDGD